MTTGFTGSSIWARGSTARSRSAPASAFGNGYTLALAAGSAFTYRYLKRQSISMAGAPPARRPAEAS